MSGVPETSPLLTDYSDGVATITLNRPESRNALSGELLRALRQAMSEAGDRDDIGAVILTGADPAFCAGLDLRELSTSPQLLSAGDADLPAGFPWKPIPKPVIGAVNGASITGGLELALNCDFLVASERAYFADTHARVGILPGWGLSVLLPERVGFAMARRMSFTGDFVDSKRALEAGLVTEVVAHEELLPTARRLATTIAGNYRPAVSALHASYRNIEKAAAGDGLALEQEAAREYRGSGQSEGIGDRVPGVISRGRTQVSRP